MSLNKIIKWILFNSLLIMCFLLRTEVYASFSPDIEKKPVTADPIYEAPSDIDYYSDKELSHWKGNIEKSRLTLSITQAEGKALYGQFEKAGEQEAGWFAIGDFISDPDYEHGYATVRDSMYVYTDSALDQVQSKIKKYSGVIIISDEGSSKQVIYQKKTGYGIGWMSEDALTNTLVFDGREKQTLSDGLYQLRCGYQDDIDGGAAVKDQPGMKKYDPHIWELSHITQDQYYIKDSRSGKYLSVYTRDGSLSFALKTTGEPDRNCGSFQMERVAGSYTIRNTYSRLYLGQDEETQNLLLKRYRVGTDICWRVSAAEKTLDEKAPMVFTQYDPQWCGTAYGSEGCMGTAGCGILATVNAVYALSGHYMDVMELADYAVEKNYRIIGSGTDDGIFRAACKKYGRKYNFTWDGHGGSINQLKKKLAKGDTAVVHVQGHYVAVVAHDKKKNRFLMLDSNYLPKREDTAFGDWISVKRLLEGSLEAQEFYYFKLRDPSLLSPF